MLICPNFLLNFNKTYIDYIVLNQFTLFTLEFVIAVTDDSTHITYESHT